MAEAVLDASAVIALLRKEPGWEKVDAAIDGALISVVNEAEVISVLIQKGRSANDALEAVRELPYRLIDLDRGIARRAGQLWMVLKKRGLSLGDRCCLALAEKEGLTALTTDRRWADLTLGVNVEVIR